MKTWTKFPINLRINILIVSMLLIAFAAMGFYIYQNQRETLINETEERMQEQLTDLTNFLQMQLEANQARVNQSLLTATDIFSISDIFVSDSILFLNAINQITQEAHKVNVNQWMWDTLSLHHSFQVVDRVSSATGATATIFQKIDKGFLRISTNVLRADGSRAVGTYIPSSSPVIQAILNGQTYQGRAFVVTDWYLTAYKPLVIDGKVEGILYVGIKEKDYESLKRLFAGKKYFERGYPFIVGKDGTFFIHPDKEGANVKETGFFKSMIAQNSPQGVVDYVWPENASGEKKRAYYQYFEAFDSYVAVSYYTQTITNKLNVLRYAIIIGAIITVIIFALVIGIFINRIFKGINPVVHSIAKMSKGEIVDKLPETRNDEIGMITSSLNSLIDGLSNTSEFSNQIGEGKLNAEFTPLSKEDVLGNSLIRMRDNLKTAKEEEAKRKLEDDQRNWAATGLAKFAELLRQNNDDMEKLGFDIIRNLVNYLGINQGGLFVLNDENPSEKYLELVGCYAYDRQKYLHKRIEIGEGLVGACYLEQQSIFLTDVPDSYVTITSGLGEETPRCLLITPLKLNESIYGIIELASFKPMEAYQVEFVEKVAESIASTISGVKVNIRTAKLLEQSQIQAEELRSQEEEMRQNMEELQTTQEEMAKKEAEMQGILEAVDLTLVKAEYDTKGNMLSANAKFAEVHGYTMAEMKRMSIENLISHLEIDEFRIVWENVVAGIHYEGISQRRTKNGRSLWLLNTYTPVKDNDGRIAKVLYLASDITEQKEIENEARQNSEELKANEEEMRQNMEELVATQEEMGRKEAELSGTLNAIHGSSLVVEFAMDGEILSINENFLALFGLRQEDMLGKNHADFDERAKNKPQEYKKLWDKLKLGQSVNLETRIALPDKELWLNETYTPIKDSNGQPFKVLNIALNITEIKQQEKIMKEQAEEMKQQAEELRASEEEMRQNLEELSATQEELQRVAAIQKENDEKLKAEYEQQIMEMQSMFMDQLTEMEKQIEAYKNKGDVS